MTSPGERLWFEPKLRRGSDAEIEAAARAYREAKGIEDDDDDWSFEDEPAPPDPIAADVFGGISRRSLAQASVNSHLGPRTRAGSAARSGDSFGHAA